MTNIDTELVYFPFFICRELYRTFAVLLNIIKIIILKSFLLFTKWCLLKHKKTKGEFTSLFLFRLNAYATSCLMLCFRK